MLLADLQLKAVTDREFRAAMVADPRGALAAQGLTVPDGIEIRVVESTERELVLAVPPALPQDVELGEESLAGVAGGTLPPLVVAWIGIAAVSGAVGGGIAGAFSR